MTSVLISCFPLPLLSSLYLCPHFLEGKGVDERWGIPFEQARLCIADGGGDDRGAFGLARWKKKGKRAGDLRQLPYGADFFPRLPHSINIRLIRHRSSSPPVNLATVFRNERQKRPTNRQQAVRTSGKTSAAVQPVDSSAREERATRLGAVSSTFDAVHLLVF